MQHSTNTILGIDLLKDNIDSILALPVSVYWKDTKGAYLGINETFAKVAALRACEEAIGHSDLDLIWAEQAHIMMNNDQKIIKTGCSKTYIELASSPKDGIVRYLSHKSPLRARGKIIGTFGVSFLMDETSLAPALANLASRVNNPVVRDNLNDTALKYSISTYQLTPRQFDCLYCLVKGMTLREIGHALKLSPKTVEHYLDAVKDKLGCHKRSDLIAKALQIQDVRDRLRRPG